MTFLEQAIGLVSVLVFLAGFIGLMMLYVQVSRRGQIAMMASAWVVTAVLYRVVFYVLPEDSWLFWVLGPALGFVFTFAFWGVIDVIIHGNIRLRGGRAARLVQGAALLSLSIVLLIATFFLPDALLSLPLDVGFGTYFVAILGAAVAAVLCFRAGARAVYENWSALPELLAAQKASLEVTPEKNAYLPGETVTATVRVEGKKDLDIHSARADLLYSNRYSYLTADPRGGSLLIDDTDRVVVATSRFMQGEKIPKRGVYEHRVSLDLPLEAPPTGEGKITGVAWGVEVVLDTPGGPDVRREAPITILSTRDTYSHLVKDEEGPDIPANRMMELRLPGLSFRAGERIEGTLVITPRDHFSARELRVELIRREIVRRDEGNGDETVEVQETLARDVRLRPGISREYAFGITVPREVASPTSETEQTYVGWFIRCVADRKRRTDYTLEQELNIYTGLPENTPSA